MRHIKIILAFLLCTPIFQLNLDAQGIQLPEGKLPQGLHSKLFKGSAAQHAQKNNTVYTPATRIDLVWDRLALQWDSLNFHHYQYFWDGDVQVDSILNYTGTWTNFFRNVSTQDAFNMVNSTTYYHWWGAGYEPWTKDVEEHNSHGDIVLRGELSWNGMDWDTLHMYRNSYVYDLDDNLTLFIQEAYDTITNDWRNMIMESMTYSSAGPSTITIQFWDGASWVNTMRLSYEYNAIPQVDRVLMEDWDGFNWINATQVIDIVWYDWSAGKVQSYRTQSWVGATWENDERCNILHSSYDSYQETFEQWDGWIWENYWMHREYYDSHHQLTLTETRTWEGTYWEGSYGTRNTYTYDGMGNILRKVVENMNGIGGDTAYYNDTTYVFGAYSVGADEPTPGERFLAWPNPTHGAVNVALPSEGWTLALVDARGQRVELQAAQIAQDIHSIALPDMPRGIYLLVASKEAQLLSTRLLVE